MIEKPKERWIPYRPGRTGWDFLSDEDNRVRAIMGPFGSGKSSVCCMAILDWAQKQTPARNGRRYTKFLVARNTFRQLQDTTIPTWLTWFPESDFGRLIGKNQRPSQLIEWNDLHLEVIFRSVDNQESVGDIMSLDLTGFWFNEYRFLQSRALMVNMLGRTNRYPPKKPAWGSGPLRRGAILDSNPPDESHWAFKIFEEEKPDGWAIYKQPSGRSAEAENRRYLGDTYYDDLIADAGESASAEQWVKAMVDGEYAFIVEGVPVYGKQYVDRMHAHPARIEPMGDTLVLGVDFGLTPAAVIWNQDNVGRWRAIHEVVADDLGALQFGRQLKREIKREYPGWWGNENRRIRVWTDPAGDQRSQVDKKTPINALRGLDFDAKPGPTQDFEQRRDALGEPMMRLVDGRPGVIVSSVGCPTFRRGLMGGYHLPKVISGGAERVLDRPDKNSYSHVVEAGQYGLSGEGEGIIKAPLPERPKKRRVVRRKRSWMG